ncbi:MAG: mechanosensitive ion channel family protein, partial [Elusimicrobiota bacterium]
MPYELLGNPLKAYLSALFVFLGVLAALLLARRLLLARLRSMAEKTSTDLDDFLVSLLGMIRAPEYYLLAFYLASRGLALGDGFAKALGIAVGLLLSFRAATLLLASTDYGFRKALGASPADASAAGAVQALRTGLHVVIWLGAGVFVLDNLGINISTVVAGLGIGGVAVALASQHILGDLFSSFVILMDKPFRTGDAIQLDDMAGAVEHIGIKTTRVRSLGGELLIFPNSLLTSARLRNYGQMRERRVLTRLRLVYQTPAGKLRGVPALLKRL